MFQIGHRTCPALDNSWLVLSVGGPHNTYAQSSFTQYQGWNLPRPNVLSVCASSLCKSLASGTSSSNTNAGGRSSAMLLWSQRDISLIFQEWKYQPSAVHLKTFGKGSENAVIWCFATTLCITYLSTSQAFLCKLRSASSQTKLLNSTVSTSWQVLEPITKVEQESRRSNLLLLIFHFMCWNQCTRYHINTPNLCTQWAYWYSHAGALCPRWAITPLDTKLTQIARGLLEPHRKISFKW